MRPHEWSVADCEKIKELWAKGRTHGQIAIYFGCSYGAISGIIGRLGLTRKPTPPRTI